MTYEISDKICQYCKEDKNRETRYLVKLPIPTQRQNLPVYVCEYCDSPTLLEMSYKPR